MSKATSLNVSKTPKIQFKFKFKFSIKYRKASYLHRDLLTGLFSFSWSINLVILSPWLPMLWFYPPLALPELSTIFFQGGELLLFCIWIFLFFFCLWKKQRRESLLNWSNLVWVSFNIIAAAFYMFHINSTKTNHSNSMSTVVQYNHFYVFVGQIFVDLIYNIIVYYC